MMPALDLLTTAIIKGQSDLCQEEFEQATLKGENEEPPVDSTSVQGAASSTVGVFVALLVFLVG
jgi:hypothetical protein